MSFDSVEKLPSRVQVGEVMSSRYAACPPGARPENWERRIEGVDVIATTDGRTLRLWSDGQQSVPAKGWVLMLLQGDAAQGYRWTLFGIPRDGF